MYDFMVSVDTYCKMRNKNAVKNSKTAIIICRDNMYYEGDLAEVETLRI